jgi:class 3 adenylate cyclase
MSRDSAESLFGDAFRKEAHGQFEREQNEAARHAETFGEAMAHIAQAERLLALRCEVFDPRIAEQLGRIVRTTGDGFLAEFASVVDAVRCANRSRMSRRNTEMSSDRRIPFRISINVVPFAVPAMPQLSGMVQALVECRIEEPSCS